MDINSCYQLGYVIKPHGLQGDVNIYIDADDPMAYKNLESVLILQDNQLIPFFITSLKISGNKALLNLEESNNIESANNLKGAELYLPLEALPELEGDQFYYHDIIGYKVKDDSQGDIGKIVSIMSAGPQDIITVDHKGQEVLIPINDDTVYRVDKKKELVYVNLPDGLLEIYTSE
ncbi:MAG: ribosome maturation factor RimM [Bacteroidota bacterium]